MGDTATLTSGHELIGAPPQAHRIRPAAERRFTPVAAHPTHADARVETHDAVPIDWEDYLAQLRLELDEVYAKLAFVERALPNGARPDHAPDATVARVRERCEAVASRLDDLSRASSAPAPVLDALGRDRGVVRAAGRPLQLGRRHTELVALLALNPRGMTTEELALGLYGETGRPGSARTELSRLRRALGPWISNDRNRITVAIDADFLCVQRLLRAGRVREAAQRYPAALLPQSEAPGIVEARDELDSWVRSAVMTSGDREALWAWLESGSGADDLPAWKRFLGDLPFDDARRPLAASRLARLRSALSVAP